jgi:hypothetical protein
VICLACQAEPEPQGADTPREGPPTARWDRVKRLEDALAQPRHPTDGGGRAWIEWAAGDPHYAHSATERTFRVVYEVGELGIARGGHVVFRPSPLIGGWSRPQVGHPNRRGFTRITPSDPEMKLEVKALPTKAVLVWNRGRSWVAGDRIRFDYGDGPSRALVGRYAEREARFWIGVDGDGDGAHAFLPDSPSVEVRAGRPAALVVTLPTTAAPGEIVDVRVALLDAHRNAGVPATGSIEFVDPPAGVSLPERVALTPGDLGRALVRARVTGAGVFRLRARFGDLESRSNPLVVGPDESRILWGDLHGHSGRSDGTGTPDDFFTYARDVAGLDIVALTDHDHLGILPLDERPETVAEIAAATRRFHEPGRFVTLPGYEWTSWIHGHRHVLFFEGEAEILSSVDPRYESPLQLWRALAGRAALTFAHHSAGGPIATNWEIPPDPVLEPVTEIVSVHGSSEADDSPAPLRRRVQGNSVRDALQRGYRLGFIGSGDTHDGHPGVTHLGYASGGLAAIASESLTRSSVLEALRARRVYATNGWRILLRVQLGDGEMGSAVAPSQAGEAPRPLRIRVVAVTPLDRIDVIRSGVVVESIPGEGRLELATTRDFGDLKTGEYLYVRAVQKDGGAAWSSPIAVE